MTEADRPNVLLIVVDQFRADLLDGQFAGIAKLKNLTSLAAQSCMFRQHYTVVTPCGPSRVSLLTGQYAMNHRAVRNGTPLRHDTPNVATAMRSAGYDPLLFGYTDVALDPRALEADDPRLTSYEELLPGFTEAVRMRQESDDTAWRDHLRATGYEVPDGNELYVPMGETPAAPACYRAEDSDTAYITDRFIERMEAEPEGWFAALNYIRPHPPFVAPAPYNAMYRAEDMPMPAEADDQDDHPFVAAERASASAASTVEGFPDLPNTAETARMLRAIYLGLATEVDHHIGRVIDWLKSSGRWDSTLLIVTADHGEMLGDYGLWGKGSYHDATFHVPLLIHAPGQSARRIEAFTESIDIAPTILDYADVPVPASMSGQSLRGLIERGEGGKQVAFSEHDFANPVRPGKLQQRLGLPSELCNFAVLRTGTQRLVQFAAGFPQIAVDLSAPGKPRDIRDMPNGDSICLELTQKMLCHRMTHPESMFAKTMVIDGGVRVGST